MLGKLAHAQYLYAGFRDLVIVLNRAAAHADRTDEDAVFIHNR
jgi:hypothetical protein